MDHPGRVRSQPAATAIPARTQKLTINAFGRSCRRNDIAPPAKSPASPINATVHMPSTFR